MVLNKRLQAITFGIWLGIILTGNAFGGEIFSCVDKEGKKRIQNNPCSSKEKTINRQVFMESSQQVAPGKVDPRTGLTVPTEAERAIDATRKQQLAAAAAAERLMAGKMDQARSLAAGYTPGNAVLILSSAICGLWQSYVLAEQRQALLSQAQLLASGFTQGNAVLILSAAMGRCPASSSNSVSPPRSVINTQTGEVYLGVAGGVINPRNGEFYPDVGAGYINPRTGQFMPKQ